MANYIICYDVRAKNHDYRKLYSLLHDWRAAHLQNSVWLAQLRGPAEQIRDILRTHMHRDDTVAVIRLPGDGVVASDWAIFMDRRPGVRWLTEHYG